MSTPGPAHGPSQPPSWRWFAAAWAVTSLILLLRAWPSWDTVVDDAYISARYAWQLAAGNGLVYNAGEPAVEGYSNLAWVLLLAAGHRLSGASAHALMTGFGALFGVLGLGGCIALTGRLQAAPSQCAVLPALVLAVDPNLAVATTNGMESSMMVAAVTWAVWASIAAEGRWRWVAGLGVGALALVRPEGVAVGAAVVAADLGVRRRALWRWETWDLAAGALVVVLVLAGWRLWTYGALLPNTASAKASIPLLTALKANLLHYFPTEGPYWIGFLVALGLAAVWSPRTRPFAMVGAATLVLVLVPLRVVLWMPGGRLLLPAIALCLCALVATASAPGPWHRRSGWVAAGLVAVLLFSPLTRYVRGYDGRHSVLPGNGAERAAAHLGRYAPEGAWLVTRDAGVVPFFVGTGVRVAELHPQALTQPHPDGERADYAAHVPQNPEFFVAVVRADDQRSFTYNDDRRVFRNMTAPYTYLGRVRQHHRRHYDVWVRADLDIPPLPEEIVVNRLGAKP